MLKPGYVRGWTSKLYKQANSLAACMELDATHDSDTAVGGINAAGFAFFEAQTKKDVELISKRAVPIEEVI